MRPLAIWLRQMKVVKDREAPESTMRQCSSKLMFGHTVGVIDKCFIKNRRSTCANRRDPISKTSTMALLDASRYVSEARAIAKKN
jgi:hypothetical protein